MKRESAPSNRNASNQGASARAAGLVVLVGDEPAWLRALRPLLEADGHRVELAADLAQFEGGLSDAEFAVVLVDLHPGRSRDLGGLERVKVARPGVEVIVVTADASIEGAVECMRHGAFDYLAKPFEDPQRVRGAVNRAVERGRQVRRSRELGIDDAALQRIGGVDLAASGLGRLFESRGAAPSQAESVHELPLSLEAYEKSALERTLREVGGDARAAARKLGLGRSTFYRKLAKHRLSPGQVASSRGGRSGAALGAVHPIS